MAKGHRHIIIIICIPRTFDHICKYSDCSDFTSLSLWIAVCSLCIFECTYLQGSEIWIVWNFLIRSYLVITSIHRHLTLNFVLIYATSGEKVWRSNLKRKTIRKSIRRPQVPFQVFNEEWTTDALLKRETRRYKKSSANGRGLEHENLAKKYGCKEKAASEENKMYSQKYGTGMPTPCVKKICRTNAKKDNG